MVARLVSAVHTHVRGRLMQHGACSELLGVSTCMRELGTMSAEIASLTAQGHAA